MLLKELTPWLVEPGGSIPHSKNPPIIPIVRVMNTFSCIYLRSIVIFSSHVHLGFPIGLFPVGVPVKMSKVILPSSILAT